MQEEQRRRGAQKPTVEGAKGARPVDEGELSLRWVGSWISNVCIDISSARP